MPSILLKALMLVKGSSDVPVTSVNETNRSTWAVFLNTRMAISELEYNRTTTSFIVTSISVMIIVVVVVVIITIIIIIIIIIISSSSTTTTTTTDDHHTTIIIVTFFSEPNKRPVATDATTSPASEPRHQNG